MKKAAWARACHPLTLTSSQSSTPRHTPVPNLATRLLSLASHNGAASLVPPSRLVFFFARYSRASTPTTLWVTQSRSP